MYKDEDKNKTNYNDQQYDDTFNQNFAYPPEAIDSNSYNYPENYDEM